MSLSRNVTFLSFEGEGVMLRLYLLLLIRMWTNLNKIALINSTKLENILLSNLVVGLVHLNCEEIGNFVFKRHCILILL